MNIIQDKQFIKSIEKYVFSNDKKSFDYIIRNRSKIPQTFRKGGILYRGMTLENFNNLRFDSPTSWSTNPKMAEKLISSGNMFGIKQSQGNKIIFKKRIPDSKVLVNISNLIMFLDSSMLLEDFDPATKEIAFEESEVLVDRGIFLSEKDIFKVMK